MKHLLLYGAAVLSFINLTSYAHRIHRGKARATNTATWLMWVVLDIIVLASTIVTNEPFALALSYTLGASAVLLVHFTRGSWKWTWVETVCAIGTIISVILWQTLSANYAVIAGVAAMSISGGPLIRTLWNEPNSESFSVFALTTVACFITLLATWPWSIGGSLLAGAGMIYNGMLAWLTIPVGSTFTRSFRDEYNPPRE